MEAFWDGLMKLLEHPTVLAILKIVITAWVAERMEFLARERRVHDATSAKAIDTGTELGSDAPGHAKKVMKASPVGRSVEFNAVLDRVSPLLDGTKRVSKKKKVWSFLKKCLPFAGRAALKATTGI